MTCTIMSDWFDHQRMRTQEKKRKEKEERERRQRENERRDPGQKKVLPKDYRLFFKYTLIHFFVRVYMSPFVCMCMHMHMYAECEAERLFA